MFHFRTGRCIKEVYDQNTTALLLRLKQRLTAARLGWIYMRLVHLSFETNRSYSDPQGTVNSRTPARKCVYAYYSIEILIGAWICNYEVSSRGVEPLDLDIRASIIQRCDARRRTETTKRSLVIVKLSSRRYLKCSSTDGTG